MKHNIHRLIILFAIMFAATGAKAQNADKLHAEEGLSSMWLCLSTRQ